MDKIDEWMKRTLGDEPKKEQTSEPTFKKVEQKGFKKFFKPKNFQKPKNPGQAPRPQAPFRPKFNKPQVALNHQPMAMTRPQQVRQQQPRPVSQPVRNVAFRQATSRPAGKNVPFRPAATRPISQPVRNAPVRQATSRPSGQPAPFRQSAPRPSTQSTPFLQKGQLKIIPLGGLNEIGKNLMIFEYGQDIIIVDMGFEFPDSNLYGIDYVIPDVNYLEKNKKRIRGVIITHGHLDHIGGISYILPKLDFPPVYATRLTLGLIENRIKEFKLEKYTRLIPVDPDKPLRLGQFLLSFFRVGHSIPDAVGVVIDTPAGKIVHTGDFKFDLAPARNTRKTDFDKLEALGHKNVLALMCESTNALEPGHTISEKEVGETLENIIKGETGRVIVASFSTQIGRIQNVIDSAVKLGRKVFVSGRSMQETIKTAMRLDYLQVPQNLINDIKKYKPSENQDSKTLILTTGSQGEAISALSRVAKNEHPYIKIKKGDAIIISSSPIIGNEKAIHTVINNLCILGAKVIHDQIMEVHTSGHAKQEELKQMIRLVNPKYLVPIHGEYFMRQALAMMATKECGIPEDKIVMLENGNILLAENGKLQKSKETIETKYILIDGKGEGQIDSQVQMDRETMSLNGALIVLVYISKDSKKIRKVPDVVSRGFVYINEMDEITKEISSLAEKAYKDMVGKNPGVKRKDIKIYIKRVIDKYAIKKLERRPLIIPLVIEV